MLDAVRTAFEIELNGRAFYQRAAIDCADPLLRALFARFALMEGEHMETLARRYQIDLPIPARDLHERLALAPRRDRAPGPGSRAPARAVEPGDAGGA